METKTLEDVVTRILQEEGVCHLGPFENADEAFEVGRNLLQKTWGMFFVAPRQDTGEGPVALTLRRSWPATGGMRRAMICRRMELLPLGAEVYTEEHLKTRLAAMELEQPAPDEQTHPHIGGEYLALRKNTGEISDGHLKVIAFDPAQEGAERTYVWCRQNGIGGRKTCVMEELEWIPARSNHAVLVKAMHAAGLNKSQREVILAAFKELTLIEGETHE